MSSLAPKVASMLACMCLMQAGCTTSIADRTLTGAPPGHPYLSPSVVVPIRIVAVGTAVRIEVLDPVYSPDAPEQFLRRVRLGQAARGEPQDVRSFPDTGDPRPMPSRNSSGDAARSEEAQVPSMLLYRGVDVSNPQAIADATEEMGRTLGQHFADLLPLCGEGALTIDCSAVPDRAALRPRITVTPVSASALPVSAVQLLGYRGLVPHEFSLEVLGEVRRVVVFLAPDRADTSPHAIQVRHARF